jgi:hypothetical protein
MFNALLVALSLGGLPGWVARRRRPVAVVRYDRVREPRGRSHLSGLGRRLVSEPPPAPVTTIMEWDWGATRTGSTSTGSRAVFFQEG